MAGCELGGQGLIPDRGEGFLLYFLLSAGHGAHPAFCTMCTGGGGLSFPRGKMRPGRDVDHLAPSSAEVKKE
jgi:hypothetical protein